MQILPIGLIWKSKKGFTFLEIIFVLVIMSLMFTLVVPNFHRMFASVERTREGQKVFHLLEKARAEAILNAEPVDITFYTNGLCIFHYRGKILEYEDLRMKILLNDKDRIVQTFYPDGTAKHPELTFKTNEGKYLIYKFNPISGKIEMERSPTL
ncbi:hypothetical protein BBF96_03700 [Anoxybacter fermentans]|uniref:General secretion pathway GspH domain-containing protein n=1 Tax=Anoxybacter fermentans TaxID=1323375 RepID=A0A3S9SW72_9FIRM|nr:type II secretion system protein [Anoxybacter fermentans]AZR72566.1 hypothetical protein BBF96_03700 [Anoxybacter fermentans]